MIISCGDPNWALKMIYAAIPTLKLKYFTRRCAVWLKKDLHDAIHNVVYKIFTLRNALCTKNVFYAAKTHANLEIGGEKVEWLCLREAGVDGEDWELAGDHVHDTRVLLTQIHIHASFC